jgi:4-hydroxy-3-methylbut-2-en-1-yl diphosphate synthase IspG/GcpE
VPASVENRQTASIRLITLDVLVTIDDKSTQKNAQTCPKCGRKTLEYTPQVAVLSRSMSKKKRKAADESKDRLSYEPAWLCKNIACKYLRLIEG